MTTEQQTEGTEELQTETVDLTDPKLSELNLKIGELVSFCNEKKIKAIELYAFIKKLELVLADQIGIASVTPLGSNREQLNQALEEEVMVADYGKMQPLFLHLNEINKMSRENNWPAKDVIMVIFDYWTQLQERFGIKKVIDSDKQEFDRQRQ